MAIRFSIYWDKKTVRIITLQNWLDKIMVIFFWNRKTLLPRKKKIHMELISSLEIPITNQCIILSSRSIDFKHIVYT